MAKAYDRMEWPFLQGMLKALGFDERWVERIMLCVTTVSYRFLINGSPSDPVTPTRGLRQGDLLSPYLFIICAEGLSLLLQQAQDNGLIHGCRVARGAPPISHLFFAEDSLLFFKAKQYEAVEIKNCLARYETFSGQMVNYHKSSICYSKNTCSGDREMVAQILGVAQAPNFGKYLGLPAFVGRNKKAAFAYIEDKIRQRISSWNKKLLTQAGTNRGIHWNARDKLCAPKKYGGLGFKDLKAFNLAMLGKQAWRFLTNTDSLVSRVYKARYYPKLSFSEASIGNNPSYCWRSIMAAKELITSGVRRRIGNGESTSIWKDPWLQDELDPMVQTEMPLQLADAKVAGLIDQTTGSWDPHILADIFHPNDIPRILKIPISPDYEDNWYWYGDPNGCYSVKNGYRLIVGTYNTNMGFDKWNTLWHLKIPPKWKMFLWRAMSNILLTTTNLLIKRVEIDPTCAMCGLRHEDIMHSLVLCDYAKAIWSQSSLLDSDAILFAAAILYNIWRARNEAVWNAYLPMPKKVLATALAVMKAWQCLHATADQPSAAHQHPTLLPHVTVPASSAVLMQQQPPPQHAEDHLPQPRRCHIDAGYHPSTMTATAGAMLFTHTGNYISAFCAPPQSCFSPLMAEAMACKEVLSWLKNRGEQSVNLFTDCQTLLSYLSSATIQARSYLGYALTGHAVQGICNQLKKQLLTFSYPINQSADMKPNVAASTTLNPVETMKSGKQKPKQSHQKPWT
ncbi:PREDICTED: uncharacterized protein LOC109180242 [Ipomoea nil]|uniref:uncharacterized protein LOC109180242 n=1 Tax=Ipomoea nil TaxID=35883 RepID=UPI000900EDA7|nr:PREDICTED: uncharacterized protein LOC109180242 [Ipomoea nil]